MASDHNYIELEKTAAEKDQWEESRCFICLEQPHNAALLICSHHEKGCHPYICNTGDRHSNCLNQFQKLFQGSSEIAQLQDNNDVQESKKHWKLQQQQHDGVDSDHLARCSLCGGHIFGWIAVEATRRKFMDSTRRSCSAEMCPFTGNYDELRKHVEEEHPNLKPAEVDPKRQSEWMRMLQQRDSEDALIASLSGSTRLQRLVELVNAFSSEALPFMREYRRSVSNNMTV